MHFDCQKHVGCQSFPKSCRGYQPVIGIIRFVPLSIPLSRPKISHDGEGSITAVTAAVVLTDVPPAPDGAISPAASPQQFSIEYRLDETADASSTVTRSQDLGNLVERARSGNPGYLPGLPVLAARLESSGVLLCRLFFLSLRTLFYLGRSHQPASPCACAECSVRCEVQRFGCDFSARPCLVRNLPLPAKVGRPPACLTDCLPQSAPPWNQ